MNHMFSGKEIREDGFEVYTAFDMLLPLIMGVVEIVFLILKSIFTFVTPFGFTIWIMRLVIRRIFVMASMAGIASCGYLIYKNPGKRREWSYLTLLGTVQAFFSCTISRIMIQKKGMESEIDLEIDLNALLRFFTNHKGESLDKQRKCIEG